MCDDCCAMPGGCATGMAGGLRTGVRRGRGRGIRTLDIQLPKLALYQAELYPDVATGLCWRRDPAPRCAGMVRSDRSRRNERAGAHACAPPAGPTADVDPGKNNGFPKEAVALYGAPGRIRTSDHQVRSLVLYPAELRARGGEVC